MPTAVEPYLKLKKLSLTRLDWTKRGCIFPFPTAFNNNSCLPDVFLWRVLLPVLVWPRFWFICVQDPDRSLVLIEVTKKQARIYKSVAKGRCGFPEKGGK